MGIAFEMALASRGPTRTHANPLHEALARKIIELAKAGEHDAERLCEGALRALPLDAAWIAKSPARNGPRDIRHSACNRSLGRSLPDQGPSERSGDGVTVRHNSGTVS
jgi:hypothetical protein